MILAVTSWAHTSDPGVEHLVVVLNPRDSPWSGDD